MVDGFDAPPVRQAGQPVEQATANKVCRREDWQDRLARFVAMGAKRAFDFGAHDCCLAACGAALAMTGTDLAAAWRGYRGPDAAARLLAEHGGVAGIAEAVAAQFGIAEVPPAFARRGDIVVVAHSDVEGSSKQSLGFVGLDGRTVYVPQAVGWRRLPVASAVRAWQVG